MKSLGPKAEEGEVDVVGGSVVLFKTSSLNKECGVTGERESDAPLGSSRSSRQGGEVVAWLMLKENESVVHEALKSILSAKKAEEGNFCSALCCAQGFTPSALKPMELGDEKPLRKLAVISRAGCFSPNPDAMASSGSQPTLQGSARNQLGRAEQSSKATLQGK